MHKPLHDICSCVGKLNGNEFVGIRCDGNPDGCGLAITFPLGYFANDEALRDLPEEELRECVVNLFDVLSDPRLTGLQDSSIDSLTAQSPEDRSFPMQAYLHILRDFMDRGYYCEREILYKQGTSGKINWGRTIKQTRPVLSDDSVVYLNPVARKLNLDENELIALIHKFCVHEAASKVGFIFGIEPDGENPMDFDAEMFRGTLLQKLSRTFNDSDSVLFRNMLSMVEFLEKGLAEDFSTPKDFYFGVDNFEGVWEKMVDGIFGNLLDGETKETFNPHCSWSLPGEESPYNTMRPDTIMRSVSETGENEVFVVDAKYYKYGVTRKKCDLPTSDSICKQIAYAEYVEVNKRVDGGHIFNVFVMPYCEKSWSATKSDSANSQVADSDDAAKSFGMRFAGSAACDWKKMDAANAKSYYRIAGIMLDVKSVMRSYGKNASAQKEMAELVKGRV